MTLAWHIAVKDLRLQRWALIAWALVLLVTMSFRVLQPQIGQDPAWRMLVPLWAALATLGYVVIWIVCVASLIQDDSLVGSTAFWLTRPISPTQLLGAKLLVLFVCIIAPSLLLEAMVMAAWRASPGVIFVALLQESWMLALVSLVFMFLASVTSTVVRVLIVMAVVVTAELVALQILAAMIRRQVAASGSPPPMVFVGVPLGYVDPNVLVLGGTFFAIGVLFTIAYQYRHRRPGAAIAFFLAVIAVTWMVQNAWAQVPLLREPSVEQEPWARDTRVRLRTVGLLDGRPLPASESLVHQVSTIVVTAPITLDGLPAGYVATPILREAALTFEDRSRLDSIVTPRSAASINVASHVERWSPLVEVTDASMRRLGDQPAVYTGTFDFIIERQIPIATLSIAVGATASDGARSVTISGTRYESSGCTMKLTSTAIALATRAREWPELSLRYQFRDGREMSDPYAPTRDNARAFVEPRYAAGTASLLRPFTVFVREAYPRLPHDGPGPLQAACRDITMNVINVGYVGHLTRTLELHDFRLNDPFPAR
jgi:hypothetical protein